jgi:putative peptidoglycan lipid II flippase
LSFIFYLDFLALSLGEGYVTFLSLANKTAQIPLLALFMPVIEVLNIKFIESYNRGRHVLQLVFLNYLKLQFLVFSFLAIFCIFFSKEIVTILYQRGSFLYNSVINTAGAFSIFIVLIVSTSFIQLSNKILIIYEKTKLNSLLGSLGYLLMFFVAKYFLDAFYYLGIPILKVLFDFFYFLPVLLFLFRNANLNGFFTSTLIKEMSYIILAIAISFCFSYFIYAYLFNMNFSKFYIMNINLKIGYILFILIVNLILLGTSMYFLKKKRFVCYDSLLA